VEGILTRLTAGSFAVLAGAGVSRMPPSNLPTALEILDVLTKALTPHRGGGHAAVGSHPPFEVTMEFLRGVADPELGFLKFLGECRSPNPLHHFLAACVIDGVPVLTTNFDALIETAVKARHAQPTVVAASVGFVRALRRNPPYPVWKLHGSFTDARGRDLSGSIRATLSTVARAGLGFESEPSRLAVIRRLLAGRAHLVLG